MILLDPIVVESSKVSPRQSILKLLADQGCTNKLVAHYIIDMQRSGIPSSEVVERLAGATGYDQNNIASWLNVVQQHVNG